ncbi:MAG: histidine phosphatase family protein [Bacteroidales bacterium]|nr:histidine phosphatase family protein [Bacteroidales bacterium]
MKILHILRHGKSSWDYPGIDDLDRPLIERGIKNAISTGTYLFETYGQPSLIITSPAIRALHTAILIARSCGVPYGKVVIDERIYESYSSSIIEVVEELPSNYESIVVVGHNPMLTEFCNLFLPDYLENLPTSGLVTLTFDIKTWSIVNQQPVLSKVYFPRKD